MVIAYIVAAVIGFCLSCGFLIAIADWAPPQILEAAMCWAEDGQGVLGVTLRVALVVPLVLLWIMIPAVVCIGGCMGLVCLAGHILGA